MRLHRSLYSGFAVALVTVIVGTVACRQEPECELLRGLEAEFHQVNDEYSIVILRPQFMVSMFGPKWEDLSLYYSFNQAVTHSGRAMITAPLNPIARGYPMLVYTGTHWEHMVSTIFALETGEYVVLVLDFRKGSITVSQERSPHSGTPHVLEDGRLMFR